MDAEISLPLSQHQQDFLLLFLCCFEPETASDEQIADALFNRLCAWRGGSLPLSVSEARFLSIVLAEEPAFPEGLFIQLLDFAYSSKI